MKNILPAIEKLFGVYRWHPKIALRYLPIVDEIKKQKLPNTSIIEFGSAGLGIAPYIKKRVVGLDVTFSPPFIDTLIPVQASALAVPFADNSFSVAISLDMLEHIIPKDREQAISEMVRVAKNLVCIGVPIGKLSEAQDEALKKAYQKKHQQTFAYLEEQVEYGLPTIENITQALTTAAQKQHKRIQIAIQPNINLRLRWFLMQGWMSKNILANIIFRKVMLLFIPLFRQINQEPVYRQLFIVTIKPL
ncbi:class I SAM-dependent methyltransferase [Candidatus Microgenomates bacterium]|nr:MAG: class I SAM-dependent methyltransferase [Candidatus Microgenomates bacterium]